MDDYLVSNIDGANKATIHKLSAHLKAIVKSEGKRTPDYKAITNLGSERTMERILTRLLKVLSLCKAGRN